MSASVISKPEIGRSELFTLSLISALILSLLCRSFAEAKEMGPYSSEKEIEKICPCLQSNIGHKKVVIGLVINENGFVYEFSSDPVLDEESVQCLQSVLSKMQFEMLGEKYEVWHEISFPQSCITAETGWEQEKTEAHAPVKNKEKPGSEMLKYGIMLLGLGHTIAVATLPPLAYFSAGCALNENNTEEDCRYKPLFLTFSILPAAMIIAGIPLVIFGAMKMKNSSRKPIIIVAPDPINSAISASIRWYF